MHILIMYLATLFGRKKDLKYFVCQATFILKIWLLSSKQNIVRLVLKRWGS